LWKGWLLTLATSRCWAIGGAAIAALGAFTAQAYPGGIGGYSGQQVQDCNHCHTGGATPTVALEGPQTVDAGTDATYTFTITGGAGVRGGLDVSVAGDATLVPGAGTKLWTNEVTHVGPTAFSQGSVSWTFTMHAGPTGGTVTLYAAGNSTNGDGTSNGDQAATTTLAIQVPGGDAADAGGGDSSDSSDPAHAVLANEIGCSSTGSAPGASLAAFALMVLAARLRRAKA
jgi:uncharacterized protein (TIGR03382 family)